MRTLSTSFLLRGFVIFALVYLMAGCTATGPKFEPAAIPTDTALVYVFRESALVRSGNVFTIYANKKAFTELPVGSYFAFYVEAGAIEFRAVDGLGLPLIIFAISQAELKQKILLELEVEALTTYYVELDHGFDTSP